MTDITGEKTSPWVTRHYLKRRAERRRRELQATLGPHSRYAYQLVKAARGPYRWRVEKVRIRK